MSPETDHQSPKIAVRVLSRRLVDRSRDLLQQEIHDIYKLVFLLGR
jgi:hypothetical protein